MAEDSAYLLLRRAIDDFDDQTNELTNEGKVAFRKFRKIVKNHRGKIFFLPENFENPLMFVVDEYARQIEELQRSNLFLQRALDEAGVAPKKQKTKSFPWDKYPDLEIDAFRKLFDEKRPMSEVKDYIRDRAPEAEDNSTFLNQRFVQGRPGPNMPITVKNGTERTDWKELWKISTRQHAAGWIQRAMRLGNGWHKFQKNGHVPKNWLSLDPNKFIGPADRANLRNLYHSNQLPPAGEELESIIRNAGADGITEEELKQQGISTRRFEIRKQKIIFKVEDRWYHHTVAHLFVHNPDEQVAHNARVALWNFHPEIAERTLGPEIAERFTEASTVKGRRRTSSAA